MEKAVYPCPTWQDHSWGARRTVSFGTHPTRGPYTRYSTTCERCGRYIVETDFRPG